MNLAGIGKKTKAFDPDAFLRTARRRSAPDLSAMTAKVDESLYFIHQVKNAVTVKTGEFEALTRVFTGQKMYVDTRDISLAPHIMLDGMWEESFTRIFRRYITADAVVFDVGANFGWFGLMAGTDVQTGSIHFFEPNPLLASYIRKTVSVNGLWNRAKVVQKAVGKTEDDITLTIPGDYFGSASVNIDNQVVANYVDERDINTVLVQQTRLDTYIQENKLKKIDVIKIDVEGYEESVYAGMAKLVKNNPDLLVFMEFTAGSYKDPKGFFKKIATDFVNVYLCEDDLHRIDNIDSLRPTIDRDGFAMIAFSNRAL